jgi:hypothetical protein
MRVIMFQNRFAELVRAGFKKQTIRETANCKAGDELSLRRWTGRPYCSKTEILRTVTCVGVQPVRVTQFCVAVDGYLADADEFARADGFQYFRDMASWFEQTYGLPFNGFLINWEGK